MYKHNIVSYVFDDDELIGCSLFLPKWLNELMPIALHPPPYLSTKFWAQTLHMWGVQDYSFYGSNFGLPLAVTSYYSVTMQSVNGSQVSATHVVDPVYPDYWLGMQLAEVGEFRPWDTHGLAHNSDIQKMIRLACIWHGGK